jgi:4'-phosphopantetheinyl transferase
MTTTDKDESMTRNALALLKKCVPHLAEREAHVWCLSLSLTMDEQSYCFSILSPDEKLRAEKFYFDGVRQDFIAGRGLLRILLGRYLQMDPIRIQFEYVSGRPVLDHPIRFNVSHSDGLGVFILSKSRVGIDVEHIRPLADLDGLAEHFFTEQESASIRSLAGQLKQEVFFKLWTCKEAYLKGLGTGLLRPLDQIEIILESRDILAKDEWQLGIFKPANDYQAAVAVEDPAVRIMFQPIKTMKHPTIEMVEYRLTTDS